MARREHSTGRAGCTLLTGATGLLGRYLLRDLLRAGHPVAALVRRTPRATPEERITSLLDEGSGPLDASDKRPTVLEGDIAQPGLGLSADARRWVAHHCDRVVHNAAIVRFHGRSRAGEPWRTNLGGTENVRDFCRALGIEDLHYVSTAYVCGDRTGVVFEGDLDAGQGFRNDYEESKFLAEQCVREARDIQHRTIHRPAAIAGDATTGFTSSYHGFYAYLRVLSVLMPRLQPDPDGVRRIPYGASLPLDEARNVVPVDWVSQAMLQVLEQPTARDHVYHLAPSQPLSPRQGIEYASSYYGAGHVELCKPRLRDALVPRLALALRTLRSYESYGGTEPRFAMDNLTRFAPTPACPAIDEAMVHRYLAFAEQHGWGRRDAGRRNAPAAPQARP